VELSDEVRERAVLAMDVVDLAPLLLPVGLAAAAHLVRYQQPFIVLEAVWCLVAVAALAKRVCTPQAQAS